MSDATSPPPRTWRRFALTLAVSSGAIALPDWLFRQTSPGLLILWWWLVPTSCAVCVLVALLLQGPGLRRGRVLALAVLTAPLVAVSAYGMLLSYIGLAHLGALPLEPSVHVEAVTWLVGAPFVALPLVAGARWCARPKSVLAAQLDERSLIAL